MATARHRGKYDGSPHDQRCLKCSDKGGAVQVDNVVYYVCGHHASYTTRIHPSVYIQNHTHGIISAPVPVGAGDERIHSNAILPREAKFMPLRHPGYVQQVWERPPNAQGLNVYKRVVEGRARVADALRRRRAQAPSPVQELPAAPVRRVYPQSQRLMPRQVAAARRRPASTRVRGPKLTQASMDLAPLELPGPAVVAPWNEEPEQKEEEVWGGDIPPSRANSVQQASVAEDDNFGLFDLPPAQGYLSPAYMPLTPLPPLPPLPEAAAQSPGQSIGRILPRAPTQLPARPNVGRRMTAQQKRAGGLRPRQRAMTVRKSTTRRTSATRRRSVTRATLAPGKQQQRRRRPVAHPQRRRAPSRLSRSMRV